MAFLESFRASIRDIEVRCATTDAKTLDVLAEEVKVLEFSISDQVGEVPAASIEMARTEVTNVIKLLRERKEVLCPVKKFKFNRKAQKTPPAEPTPARSSTAPVAPQVAAQASTLLPCDDKVIVFTESTRQSSIGGADVHVKDADNATFVFTDDIGALHVSNLRNSVVVVCGSARIHGAALVANCDNVVMHINVRQLRLFQCTKMCCYLDIMSTPIIEQSSQIWFAPVSGSEEKTQWSKVDDFNWLHREASPNWKILPEKSRRKPALGENEDKTAEISENADLWVGK